MIPQSPINAHHKRFYTAAMATFVDADSDRCSSRSSTNTLTQYMKGLSSRPKLVVLDIGKDLLVVVIIGGIWLVRPARPLPSHIS